MSKKAKYIKNAVFYAHERPEMLADLLTGLVTDTLTSVAFTEAPAEVIIPASDSETATYKAQALSQFGDGMSNAITYSLVGTHEGATIDGSSGVLTVQSTTSPGNIQIKATSGSVSAVVDVTLSSAEE